MFKCDVPAALDVAGLTFAAPEVRSLLDRGCKQQLPPGQSQALCSSIAADPKLVSFYDLLSHTHSALSFSLSLSPTLFLSLSPS